MTTARRELVDVNLTPWYHCVSRCVRSAWLIAQGRTDRKQWIEQRLQQLAGCFAVAVGGFAIMDNHLHLLLRLEPERAGPWSDQEVARRWLAVYPPKTLATEDPKVMQATIDRLAKDHQRIDVLRGRLQNLGWFMKALKEPLARLANKEDGCRGAFWDARYKSIAILDEQALLATNAYIDLNPLAAGVSASPESSSHTSLKQRIDHARLRGKLGPLSSALAGSVAGSKAAGSYELEHWLVPLEDRRAMSRGQSPEVRAGMVASFSLGTYLQLVDYTARQYRQGKARLGPEVAAIFDRLGIGQRLWTQTINRMLGSRDLRGRYFASDRARVRELSATRGKRLANLTPQMSR